MGRTGWLFVVAAALLLWGLTARAQDDMPATNAPGSAALAPRAEPSGESIDQRVEGIVKAITLYGARLVEVVAAVIVVIAALRATAAYFGNLLRPGPEPVPKTAIRLSLGRSLALALEFLLGADILRTAVAPTWNDIGQLASIAVLRTGLNYFLERELERAGQRQEVPAAGEPVG